MTTDIRIERCENPAAWDAYARKSTQASTYHQWAWKRVIEETYGHDTYYLSAAGANELQGILPLVFLKSRLFGRFLVSLPFFNYGGVLADTPEIRQHLLAKAIEVGKEIGAQHVELRQGASCETGWQDVSAKVAMVVPVNKNTDDLFSKLSSRLRNKVRRARKEGFECRWGGAEQVKSFYSVFAPNMRNLGTPVYPIKWFENVMRMLPEACQILTLCEGKRPVATTLLTTFRDTVELPWIASLPEERKTYSTVLLYWTALEWAAQNGYSYVDLGRCTPGGGTYQFKHQWNCEERPLHWYYWLAPGVPVPELRPDNPRYRLAIQMWKRMPLPLANWLGPRIVRSIP